MSHVPSDVAGFGPAAGALGGAPGRLDFLAILSVIRGRWSVFLPALLLGVGATVAALILVKPVYTAEAELMIEQRRNSVADTHAVLGGLSSDVSSIQNQVQILTSHQFARGVVEKLKLQLDPEFNTGSTAPAARASGAGARVASLAGSDVPRSFLDPVVEKLLKRVSVTQSGLSTTIKVSVGSSNAEKAALIANTMVDSYVAEQRRMKLQATRMAVDWLGDRARALAQQAQADEGAVQKYKAENNIVDFGVSGSLVDQQTATVNLQLINAKADLAQKSALYDRIRDLQASGRGGLVSQVVESPAISELRVRDAELARQEAQFSVRFMPTHPRLREIASQRESTQAKLAVEVQRVVERLSNDVAVSSANVASLEGSLRQLQSRFQDQSVASIRLRALQSIAASSRSQYEAVLARLKEVQGQDQMAMPDARVISRAAAPQSAFPSRTMIAGLGLPASLGLAFFMVFLAEGLFPRFRSREQVARMTGVPVLSEVPAVSSVWAAGRPGGEFSPSMHNLLLSLELQPLASDTRVVTVAASVAGEGATTVVAGLARAAASNGLRVVAVDANFRSPELTVAMGLSASGSGLQDVLAGRATVEQAALRDDASGALVLAGSRDRAAAVSMRPGAMRKLVEMLRSRFDFVIIDCAPLAEAQDALAFARVSDSTVLVVRAGHTARETVQVSTNLLRTSGVPLSGIALTQVRAERAAP